LDSSAAGIEESAMFFAVITLFPEMFEAITAYGISGRAAKVTLCKSLALIHEILLRATTNEWMNVLSVVVLVW
jgi:tRNA G37 N-methylase TrmD